MTEDDLPKRPRRFEPLLLDPLAEAELKAYVEELRGEIARAAAEIERKAAHRTAAAAFFKS